MKLHNFFSTTKLVNWLNTTFNDVNKHWLMTYRLRRWNIVQDSFCFCAFFRMFTTSLENNVTHANDRNEYHVAEGISATVFRAILVSASKNISWNAVFIVHLMHKIWLQVFGCVSLLLITALWLTPNCTAWLLDNSICEQLSWSHYVK